MTGMTAVYVLLGATLGVIVVLVLPVYLSKTVRQFVWKHAWKLGIVGVAGGALVRFLAY